MPFEPVSLGLSATSSSAGSTGSATPQIFAIGLPVCYDDGANDKVTVFTYSDGSQRAFLASDGSLVDVSAGIPSAWQVVPSHVRDAQIISGIVDADELTADLEIGQAFHFHTASEVTLSSTQSINPFVNSDLTIGSTTLVIPASIQGWMIRSATGSISVAYTTPVEPELDVCGINEYIHNINDYFLAISHEGAGGTGLTINVNDAPATFQNLENAVDNADGSLTLTGGVNGNFNRRASTLQSIREVGDYFEIVKPATGQFDSQIIAITTDPTVTSNTVSTEYTLRFNANNMTVRDPLGVDVLVVAPENGTFRVTRTLSGFQIDQNGVEVYTSPTVCVDYTQVTPTTHVFDGVEVAAAPDFTTFTQLPVSTAPNTIIETGVDLTQVDRLIFSFSRLGEQSTSSSIKLDDVILDTQNGALLHWYDNTGARLRINTADLSTGRILLSSLTNIVQLQRIEFRKKAVGVSNRLGENVHIKSTRFSDDAEAISMGYLPVKPSTITNGAIDYPQWAAIYTEFVVGSDIVFPANVEGIMFRNAGGNALPEGEFQEDKTAVNGLGGTVIDANPTTISQSTGGNGGARRNFGENNATRTISLTGDNETVSDNYAYQWYSILDNYIEVVASGGSTIAPYYPTQNSPTLYVRDNGDSTTTPVYLTRWTNDVDVFFVQIEGTMDGTVSRIFEIPDTFSLPVVVLPSLPIDTGANILENFTKDIDTFASNFRGNTVADKNYQIFWESRPYEVIPDLVLPAGITYETSASPNGGFNHLFTGFHSGFGPVGNVSGGLVNPPGDNDNGSNPPTIHVEVV